MNIFHALFKTSIGKKVLMAVTGLILIGFITGHLIGNLQIFSPPDKINTYAHFLQSLGPALWGVRLFLLLVVSLHIWTAVALTLENKAARGPEKYANPRTLRATYASRTMRWSGFIVLAFIIYHLAQFTFKATGGAEFYPMTHIPHVEHAVPDVHSMMIYGFQQPIVAIFYLIAIGMLSWHLKHGVSSMFQSIGWRTRAWTKCLDRIAIIFAILYFAGNAAIVGSILAGKVKIQNPDLPATYVQACALAANADK